jgi:hypothetical protein
VEGALEGTEPGSNGSSESFLRVVMRVLTTQMGFVRRTVAEPAMAPAIMDSMVVSFMLARPDLRAAFSKNERVHSYPGFTCQRYQSVDVTVHASTVVVDEVRNGDAEQRAVQPRVQARDALALDDPARGAQGGRLRALRLDLGARRQRDEGVRQGHGEQASTGAGEGVGDIVALLRGGAGGHGGRRLGELLLGFVLDLGHGVDRFEAQRAKGGGGDKSLSWLIRAKVSEMSC